MFGSDNPSLTLVSGTRLFSRPTNPERPATYVDPNSPEYKRRVLFIGCDELFGSDDMSRISQDFGDCDPVSWAKYPYPEDFRRYVTKKRDEYAGVFVGMTDRRVAAALMSAVAVPCPEIATVAVGEAVSPDDMLAAMRAGAREFLYPPFDFEAAVGALEAAEQRREMAEGRLLCFVPAHGGAGASTVSAHVASALADRLEEQYRFAGEPPNRGVLLIDLDRRSKTLSSWAGIRPDYTLLEALQRPLIVGDSWEQLTFRWAGCDVLAAPDTNARLPIELTENLDRVIDEATRAYEFVIVDLPNATSQLSQTLLAQQAEIQVVCTAEPRSLRMIKTTVAELAVPCPTHHDLRLIINRAGAKKGVSSGDVDTLLKEPAFYKIRNSYAELYEAHISKEICSRKSKLGKEFAELAALLVDDRPVAERNPLGRDERPVRFVETASSEPIPVTKTAAAEAV